MDFPILVLHSFLFQQGKDVTDLLDTEGETKRNLFLQTFLKIFVYCMVTTAVIYLILELLVWAFLVFSGFLRFSELVNLRRSDIQIFDDYLTLNVQKSKTDRYKKGTILFTFPVLGRLHVPLWSLRGIWKKLILVHVQMSSYSDLFVFVKALNHIFWRVTKVCLIQELEKFFCLHLNLLDWINVSSDYIVFEPAALLQRQMLVFVIGC